ncbi:MAG: glycosyltransferase [Parachlamydiales bacterium]|nr:glycosyltransferase [Parachlamydiales bacterium]
MKQVDISVLITNFNHASFLPECLDAIFSQSVAPKEVILIDDASTDESIPFILEYQKRHPELTLIQNATNQGPANAMNTCITHATGKYIFLCAADDQVLPNSFELGAHYLDLYPEAGICCSIPTMFTNEKPYHFKRVSICHQKQATLIPSDSIKKQFLLTSLWIPTHASLYRRDLVVKYGCLNEGLKHLCDWYLNCKIALLHGIVYVPQSFGAFRVSTQSYSAKWNRLYLKKNMIYRCLFELLSQESASFQKIFSRSGVLGLISSDVFFHLLFQISLWKYIPSAFYRKTCNFFRKIIQSFDYKKKRMG